MRLVTRSSKPSLPMPSSAGVRSAAMTTCLPFDFSVLKMLKKNVMVPALPASPCTSSMIRTSMSS